MSRSFWIVVGAAGGIAAYRKATQLAARSRELGALGSAQAAAETTSRLAGTAAAGLSKVQDVRDRRAGRLVTGALAADPEPAAAIPSHPAIPSRPAGSMDASGGFDQGPRARSGQPLEPAAGVDELDRREPTLIPVSDDIPADWVSAATVRRAGVGEPVVVESDLAAADAARAAGHERAAEQATARTARPRRP